MSQKGHPPAALPACHSREGGNPSAQETNIRRPHSLHVIPAKAGIHRRRKRTSVGLTASTSFPRSRESISAGKEHPSAAQPPRHSREGGNPSAQEKDTRPPHCRHVIPAKSGIHQRRKRTPVGRTASTSFPRRRESIGAGEELLPAAQPPCHPAALFLRSGV
jgi:hypothetical protein